MRYDVIFSSVSTLGGIHDTINLPGEGAGLRVTFHGADGSEIYTLCNNYNYSQLLQVYIYYTQL